MIIEKKIFYLKKITEGYFKWGKWNSTIIKIHNFRLDLEIKLLPLVAHHKTKQV